MADGFLQPIRTKTRVPIDRNMLSFQRDFVLVGRAPCSVFNRTGCAQLPHKVIQCLSFLFLLGYSLMSIHAENLLDSHRL